MMRPDRNNNSNTLNTAAIISPRQNKTQVLTSPKKKKQKPNNTSATKNEIKALQRKLKNAKAVTTINLTDSENSSFNSRGNSSSYSSSSSTSSSSSSISLLVDGDDNKDDETVQQRHEKIYLADDKSSTSPDNDSLPIMATIPQPGDSLITKDPIKGIGKSPGTLPFEKIYALGDVINKGAFGTVWTALHYSYFTADSTSSALIEQQVAVKIIKRAKQTSNCDVVDMIEASILKDVRKTPNIIQLIDFYMNDNAIYIVQELAYGGDVFDRLCSKNTYTETDARELCKILFETILQLHDELFIIHRDLKPENLLLKTRESNTNILLCDFGNAQYLPESTDKGLNTYCGTPAFMAPEIFLGNEYRTEADMWSIGCMIYMLLYGFQPFDINGKTSSLELYDYITNCDWGFPEDDGASAVSENASDLISNLLTLDQKTRYTAKQCLECDWFKGNNCCRRKGETQKTELAVKLTNTSTINLEKSKKKSSTTAKQPESKITVDTDKEERESLLLLSSSIDNNNCFKYVYVSVNQIFTGIQIDPVTKKVDIPYYKNKQLKDTNGFATTSMKVDDYKWIPNSNTNSEKYQNKIELSSNNNNSENNHNIKEGKNKVFPTKTTANSRSGKEKKTKNANRREEQNNQCWSSSHNANANAMTKKDNTEMSVLQIKKESTKGGDKARNKKKGKKKIEVMKNFIGMSSVANTKGYNVSTAIIEQHKKSTNQLCHQQIYRQS